MKSAFLALSILLVFSCGVQAKDIEEVLQDAVGQVFRQTPHGFELSLEPYVNVNFDARREVTVEYSVTGDSTPNRFKRTWSQNSGVYTAVTTESGTLRNAGFLADLWSYQFRRSNEYSFRNTETIDVNRMSYKWDLLMTVDGQRSTSAGEISVASFDIVGNSASIKYVEKVDMKENCPYCDISRALGYRCPFQMDADFTVTAQASQCNHPARDCSASISVEGTEGNQAISMVLGYTGKVNRGFQVNQIGVTYNDRNLFQLTMRTPPGSDVTNILAKMGDQKPEHIITLPNKKSFRAIAMAAHEYFGGIGQAVELILENLPEAVIWFDKIMATATDEFDCTSLVQATKIRIPILNGAFEQGYRCDITGAEINGKNFQEFGASFCQTFNNMVKAGLTQLGGEIAGTRRYVNRITSPAHGAAFAANL